MINSVLIICSIFFSSLGLNGISSRIDQSFIQQGNIEAMASGEISLPTIAVRPEINPDASDPNIYAQNYILIDRESGLIIAKQNSDQRVPIASTTKIMTAILVLERYNLDDVLTVSAESANLIGSGLYASEKMTVLNLLKCLLINSYNGAAYTLAEHINNSYETGDTKFISMMNQKAAELGMADTEFHDAAGLDTSGYSTAYDLTLVTKYAMNKTLFNQIVVTKTAAVSDISGKITHQLKNSNRLVAEWDYPGILGVKTGYMDEAGHCLVAAARRNGHTFISVVLKTTANTPTASALESRKLLDWGFANTKWE